MKRQMALYRKALAEPEGFKPTTVPGKGVSVPFVPIANPEIDAVPAFDVYTKRPSGVTTFQQFAAPRVGTVGLMGASVLFGWML